MKLISGEQLQSLSQISFCKDRNCIIDKQVKTHSQNINYIDLFTLDEIANYTHIFCYTDAINDFLQKFFNHLRNDITIITHNSDLGIDSKYEHYLNGNKIKRWFCQNRYINHNKLSSLPIGLANSQWEHGNQDMLSKIKSENNKKEILVYKNFDIGTNIGARTHCNDITNKLGISMYPRDTNENYWRSISKSVFTIAPHGNGVDSHRIWECLYLESVPIVEYHECFSQFKHLPILFVDSYRDITKDFLKQKIDIFYPFSKYNLEILDLNYWKYKMYE